MTDPIPPDIQRCQAEKREGSFMTLGPPVYLAVEIVDAPDGRRGSMSLCLECAKVMMDVKDLRERVQLQPIAKES